MPSVFEEFKQTLRGMFARDNAPHSEPYQGRWAYQSVGNSIIAGHDSYDNVFPYVNAISNRFASIIPYAVNEQGDRISTPPAIQALYAPNSMMSCREFLSYLATSLLVNSHTDILVWTPDGPAFEGATPDNVTGYTFLPSDARVYNTDGTYYFQTQLLLDEGPRLCQFAPDSVISLVYARHPSDLSVGVAPAMTVTKWANVDDMLADYERGFFGNGTVPAGMIEIIAESPQDFMQTKTQIEQRFRGAQNHNSVVYNYRPADPVTHQTMGESKIAWTPFAQSNDSLDLETLNDVVNNRLANAMAVPDIIRGIDNGQTYSNAEQAQMTFIENTLQPLCLNVWDKWQFELDRITGGLGYGITFDLDLPAQTDVEKTRADTTSTNVDNLLKLIDYGASVDDAVEALGLPEEYKRLKFNTATEEQTIEDTVPVLHTSRYETTTTNKLLQVTRDILDQTWAAIQTGDYVDIEALADKWGEQVYDIVADMIVSYGNEVGRKLEDSLRHMDDDDIIVPILAAIISQNNGLVNWQTLPNRYEQSVREHLHTVIVEALTSAQTRLQDYKAQAEAEGWSDSQLNTKVRDYLDHFRSRTLAKTERQIIQKLAEYYAASDISDLTHLTVYKTWHAHLDDSTCRFCRSMNNVTIPVTEAFMQSGETKDVDGETLVNDYETMEVPNAHPNCRCWATYSFREA